MLNYELNIHIDEPFEGLLDLTWLRQVALVTQTREGVSPSAELSFIITDGETVQELNRKYRGKDEPTDVLAFALQDGEPFIAPPDGILHLGEVFISYPQAVMQAKEYNHPVEREMAILTIHGVLHLLGYDHEREEDEQAMRAREEEALKEVERL